MSPCGHDGWVAGCPACEREEALAVALIESLGEPRCPYCDRVMSRRESAEQGACNDCYGGAWSPE